ncbi:MAG: hypothetical protein GTN62_10245, partial [Gemmatimonadales bacterium]|nr:hypothetical protein [Gemmatimonadales bacterium]NIN50476.1 hypothetical protein [Gemmatimonadales bacterium]NIP07940.1 hypothetical protein [Gemmatimonadales bacterium]NIS64812.1 hypothetical protein [Gemmatimonadales bacterium]
MTARRGGVQVLSARAGKDPEVGSGYTFLRKHKQGGLGTIWVVRDESAARDVALKKLRADVQQNPYARKLMRDEALVTAQLQHPNIVPVYNLGTDEAGDFFYTMRLVHGQTLSEQIDALRKSRPSGRLSTG